MILILALLASAQPAPDPAPGSYYVRNQTSRTFTCGFRREPRRRIHRFLLRRGTDYSYRGAGGSTRTLLCDTRPTVQRFPMQAGVRYALVERHGYVTLHRIVAP